MLQALWRDTPVSLPPALLSILGMAIMSSAVGLGQSYGEWPREPEAACLSQLFGDEQLAQREGLQGLSLLIRIYGRCGASHHLLARRTEKLDSLEVFSAEDLGARLDALRRARPSSSFAEICAGAKTKHRTLSGPKLEALLDRLEQLKMKPVLTSPIVMDGVAYEVWIFSVTGLSHYRYQIGADVTALDPLQEWVEEFVEFASSDCVEGPSR